MPAPLPIFGRPIERQPEPIVLAMLVFGEARGEEWLAKLGVAYTAVNRVAAQVYGATLTAVALATNQFSCFRLDDPNRQKLLHPLQYESQQVWDDCYAAALHAQLRTQPDPANGAEFYHDTRIQQPPADWGQVYQCAQLGRLTFYRRVPIARTDV